MGKHVPTVVWSLRGPGSRSAYLQTNDEQSLRLSLPDPEKPGRVYGFVIERKDARLLAKRINQCLDDTRSK